MKTFVFIYFFPLRFIKILFYYVSATRRPFYLFFRTDGSEIEADGGKDKQTGITNEEELIPGGIIGFSLDFSQMISC